MRVTRVQPHLPWYSSYSRRKDFSHSEEFIESSYTCVRRLHDASELLSPWQWKLWTRVVSFSPPQGEVPQAEVRDGAQPGRHEASQLRLRWTRRLCWVCKRFSVKRAWFLLVIECRMWSDRKLCKYTVIDKHPVCDLSPLDEGNENEALPEPPNSQLSWKQGRQLLRQWVMSHFTLKSCDEWTDTFKNTHVRSPAFFSYSTHARYF